MSAHQRNQVIPYCIRVSSTDYLIGEVRNKHGITKNQITIRWIPEHKGVEADEEADEEARSAASSPTNNFPARSLPRYIRTNPLPKQYHRSKASAQGKFSQRSSPSHSQGRRRNMPNGDGEDDDILTPPLPSSACRNVYTTHMQSCALCSHSCTVISDSGFPIPSRSMIQKPSESE